MSPSRPLFPDRSRPAFPDRIGEPIIIPHGVDPQEFLRRRSAPALGRVINDEQTGTAQVNCPYCILYMKKATPIDVTKFVDQDGSKEYVVYCAEGHRVAFKPIPQWREQRQRLGLQVKG